jgi:hypothetical protein
VGGCLSHFFIIIGDGVRNCFPPLAFALICSQVGQVGQVGQGTDCTSIEKDFSFHSHLQAMQSGNAHFDASMAASGNPPD